MGYTRKVIDREQILRQEEICRTLIAAAKDGTLSEERIDESLRRILHAKSLYGDWSGYRG